jgi:teichoic acid transport system permease protein
VPFQTILNIGLAFAAARINYGFRDFFNILPFLFRILFYLSGVLFSINAFVETPLYRTLFVANPIYSYLSIYRWAMMGEPATWSMVVSALAWSFGAFFVGVAYFISAEESYGRG